MTNSLMAGLEPWLEMEGDELIEGSGLCVVRRVGVKKERDICGM